jgi:GrpB-like predicted nucleotidyltransferase (UPF0157 family)
MRTIEVVDYDPAWPSLFEAERNLLCETLGDVVVEIYHIGSTAVPGLAAKPIIDINLVVTDLQVLDELTGKMASIGYVAKGEFGIPGRRYFQKGGDRRTHQLHAFPQDDPNTVRHLAFRDYLRANPKVAEEYAMLKKDIAATCNNDIDRYCDGKDAYVKRIEATAIREMAPNQSLHRTPPSGPGEL